MECGWSVGGVWVERVILTRWLNQGRRHEVSVKTTLIYSMNQLENDYSSGFLCVSLTAITHHVRVKQQHPCAKYRI